jgi:undecaprenyl-diphosphatase
MTTRALAMAVLPALDARDRALYRRWALGRTAPARTVLLWKLVTAIGGIPAGAVLCTVVVAGMLVGVGAIGESAWRAGWVLALTQAIVQTTKRIVTRRRPTDDGWPAHITPPPGFSFPSGHAAWSIAAAMTGAAMSPALGPVLVTTALLIGASRVRLGVHYPGDVVAGQVIGALASAIVLSVA